MVQRTVFGCPGCNARWTDALRPLPAWLPRDAHGLCGESPAGFWSRRDDLRARPDHPVAVHVHDVKNLRPHPDPYRRIGCCGVGFRAALPNLLCARCGAEAGYELTDGDHCRHAVFLPMHKRLTIVTDEPDDDALHARFVARQSSAATPRPDAGMDAAPARLRVDPEAIWADDLQRPAHFPKLHSLGVAVTGTEVRLSLDGVWLRPPWPESERDRVLALGALPRGRADAPLYWWRDLPGPDGRVDRHQWHQWGVQGALCVAWQRMPGARSDGSPCVGFRVVWSAWADAWRAALGG